MKVWHLPVQLLLVALAVPLALLLSSELPVIRSARAAPAASDLWILLSIYLSCHFLASLSSLLIYKDFAFASVLRLLRELCFAAIANALAASYHFVLTTVPFSPSLVAYVYVLIPLFYFMAFLLIGLNRRTGSPLPMSSVALPSVWRLVRSGLFCVTLVLAPAPGLLFILQEKHQGFAGLLETIRVSVNVDTHAAWTLADLDPGLTFDQPLDLRFLDDDEFYLLERAGRIKKVVDRAGWRAETVLDFSHNSVSTAFEDGALSFALHPEFDHATSKNKGFVYVYYTHVRGDVKYNRLSRFDLSLPTAAERLESELLLIEQQADKIGFHNGGSVLFGLDGFLYLSLGDTTNKDNGQNVTDNLLAGVIRIDVDRRGGDVSAPIRKQGVRVETDHYYIPKDNPFVGDDGVLDEYWALGFRNPFRMSMDGETGEIWLGDVGLRSYEEINRIEKGANGQWPYREGPVAGIAPKPDRLLGIETPPVYAYEHTLSDRAVIGGIRYRGRRYPSLYGMYVFADVQSGVIRSLNVMQDEPVVQALARMQSITSVTESPEGEIVLTVLGSTEQPTGRILRLTRSDETTAAALADPDAPVASTAIYDRLCARCHGADGKGEPFQHLDRRPDFTNADWQASVTDAYIREVILRGGEAVGLDEAMPSWQGIVTDQELDHLVEKIRSFAPTEGGRPTADQHARDRQPR